MCWRLLYATNARQKIVRNPSPPNVQPSTGPTGNLFTAIVAADPLPSLGFFVLPVEVDEIEVMVLLSELLVSVCDSESCSVLNASIRDRGNQQQTRSTL